LPFAAPHRAQALLDGPWRLKWQSSSMMQRAATSTLLAAVSMAAVLGSWLAVYAAPLPAALRTPLLTCHFNDTLHSCSELLAPQSGCAAVARTIAGVEQRA
jgi:hypothetical protein